eukprot:181718-Amphidinium_carterae.1
MKSLVGELGGHSSVRYPPVAMTYLLTVYFNRYPPKELGVRTERELCTLMVTIDHILRGDPARALDTLAQRVKSLERSVMDKTWDTA